MKPYQRLRRDILNLPNTITFGRLLLVPPVLWLMTPPDPWNSFLAMFLFMIAGVLDAVDGYLARMRGLVTTLGKFIDPLVDKLMVMAVLVFLVSDGRVPAWFAVTVLARELYISGLRSLASSEGVVIAAGSGGKYKTLLQLVGLCSVLLHFKYPMYGLSISLNGHVFGMTLLYVSLGFSIVSAFQYTAEFRRVLRQQG